jgi:hypothetical protein
MGPANGLPDGSPPGIVQLSVNNVTSRYMGVSDVRTVNGLEKTSLHSRNDLLH